MSNIYTYEVDHGDEAPSVGAGTIVNGGKVTTICFDGQLSKNQKAHDILESIFEDFHLENYVRERLLEVQALI